MSLKSIVYFTSQNCTPFFLLILDGERPPPNARQGMLFEPL